MTGREVGERGEQLACDILKKQGVHILARNYGTHGGEIDIVGFRRGGLLFFEVKTRTGNSWGTAAEAIGEEKLRRVERAGKQFIYAHVKDGKIPVLCKLGFWIPRRVRYKRIDGIEIYLYPDGKLKTMNRIEDMGYEIRQHPRTE